MRRSMCILLSGIILLTAGLLAARLAADEANGAKHLARQIAPARADNAGLEAQQQIQPAPQPPAPSAKGHYQHLLTQIEVAQIGSDTATSTTTAIGPAQATPGTKTCRRDSGFTSRPTGTSSATPRPARRATPARHAHGGRSRRPAPPTPGPTRAT